MLPSSELLPASDGPTSAEQLRFPPLLTASLQTSLYHVELSQLRVKHPRTQSALLYLFGGECEHGEQFDHDLYNNIRHQRGELDRSVDFKSLKEISEAFKQVYE